MDWVSSLGEFAGGGVIPLSMYADNGTIWNVSGAGTETQHPQADFTMKVIYDYSGTLAPDAVPEPSAGILLGMGGLICWAWRRKAVKQKLYSSVAQ